MKTAAGQRQVRVTFERPCKTDVDGQIERTWVPHCRRWCRVQQIGAGETIEQSVQTQEEIRYRITAPADRETKQIDSTFRAKAQGRKLYIGSAIDVALIGDEVVITGRERPQNG